MVLVQRGWKDKTALFVLFARKNNRKAIFVAFLYPTKRYLHFDHIVSYNDRIKSYVEDPKRIERHSFFPFIKFEKKNTRFVSYDYVDPNTQKPTKDKIRPIMYASHIDGFIYRFYSDKINEKYNDWVSTRNFDECPTAYRNNKKGKSNIHYAVEVIDFIVKSKDCYIMVGDYEHFFDTLDHSYLKQKLKNILKMQNLPLDYYNVLKSVMRYSYVERMAVEEYLKQKGQIVKMLKAYFMNPKAFRLFRNETDSLSLIKPNKEVFGIPQGTALSAVLANVYMIDVDEKINDIVKAYGGMYRRYSDDFIVVISKKCCGKEGFIKNVEQIKAEIQKSRLNLQEEKTELFEFNKSNVYGLENRKKDRLDYLGFCFDGQNVFVRQKSIYKFYRNAYKCIEIAKNRSKIKGLSALLYRRKIYRLYTHLGKYDIRKTRKKQSNHKYYGNFLSYMERAESAFKQVDQINCCILQQIRHWKRKIYYDCTMKDKLRKK